MPGAPGSPIGPTYSTASVLAMYGLTAPAKSGAMLTDFVTSDIVGGAGSFMLGQRVRNLILEQGDWGAGSALTFLLLAMSVVLSLVAYRLARLNRIDA